MAETYQVRIKKIIRETGDTKSFVLQRIDNEEIVYKAGQFLTFLFRQQSERRSYSISSVPGEDTMITVKRIPNGEYSRYFFDRASEGDVLETIGASGFFVLPEKRNDYDQYVFFAAGSGITPVYAMIRSLLDDPAGAKILLVYSNRSLNDAIFYRPLMMLQAQHSDHFHIEFLFSDATHVEHKRLGIYVLEKILVKYVNGSRERQVYYLCGPFEYMRMITIVLRNNAVPAGNIRKETFQVEVPDRKPAPPDRDVHEVEAIMGSEKYTFRTQYPDTILQTAKLAGVPIPYSCEAGQCGTCAATCISGKVWMWRNDVLLDNEIANGRVLTCTGYPIGGDVKLQF